MIDFSQGFSNPFTYDSTLNPGSTTPQNFDPLAATTAGSVSSVSTDNNSFGSLFGLNYPMPNPVSVSTLPDGTPVYSTTVTGSSSSGSGSTNTGGWASALSSIGQDILGGLSLVKGGQVQIGATGASGQAGALAAGQGALAPSTGGFAFGNLVLLGGVVLIGIVAFSFIKH